MAISTASPNPEPNAQKPHPSTIILRRAHLSEYTQIGHLAALTYRDKPLSAFLSPHRLTYPTHYITAFQQRNLERMLDPRNICIVAVEKTQPGKVVGYIQLQRLGNDAYAKALIAKRWVWVLWALSLLFAVWCKVFWWWEGGDKSASKKNEKLFRQWAMKDSRDFWQGREERWYVQSCVVGDEWQGLGIGKRLIGEVLVWAEKEGVVVALEASEEGEWLYRSVGFELLGRFRMDKEYEKVLGEGGGIMMWSPTGKGEKKRL